MSSDLSTARQYLSAESMLHTGHRVLAAYYVPHET